MRCIPAVCWEMHEPGTPPQCPSVAAKWETTPSRGTGGEGEAREPAGPSPAHARAGGPTHGGRFPKAGSCETVKPSPNPQRMCMSFQKKAQPPKVNFTSFFQIIRLSFPDEQTIHVTLTQGQK